MTRVAAGVEIGLAAAFGGAAVWAVDHLRKHGELPMTPFGFRALSGPFEALGPRVFSILGVAFAAVCAVDVVAGILLWQRRRVGLALGFVAAVPQFLLAVGFALPFLIVGVAVRIALSWIGRRELR